MKKQTIFKLTPTKIFLILILFISGCKLREEIIDFHNDDMRIYTRENFYKYDYIYKLAIDSVIYHSKKRFNDFTLRTYKTYWELDSCFVFNSDSTRLMGIFYYQNINLKNDNADGFFMFNGFKINGQWRFGQGRDSWVAPHDFYGDSLYATLPMYKIKYLAHHTSFAAYLNKKEDGSFEPNYKLLDDYFYNRKNLRLPEDYHKRKFDSIVLKDFSELIYNSYVADKELHELDSIFKNSVQPPEPLKDSKGRYIYDEYGNKIKRSWWDKFF